eukprot:XP_011665986.1 PREDICTED: VPS9 domain-containing protein 1 isoform X1 [Strongylocentrotus purpuratus]
MELRSENPEEQKQLQTAMKAVGQAIQLDTSGSAPDAYLHYLSCMQYISQCLLQDARAKVCQAPSVNLKTKGSMKMVKLAQQCSERVADIMNNMEETSTPTHFPLLATHQTATLSPSPTPPSSLTSSMSSSLSPSLSSSIPSGRISPSMFPAVPSTFSHAAPSHVAVVRPTVQQPDPQRSPAPNASPNHQSDEALGPLEKAYRENRKLMATYRSRLNKMHTTSKNKSLVNLTFQRRLMENMAIAKAREASLAKKIKERQQRLKEQAAQRFSSSGQPTKEEMELRTVYANIMEYENVKTWLQDRRQRLQESPGDLRLIHDLITEILSCDQHPLSQLLKRYQITIYQKIMPLIQRKLPSIEEIVVPFKDVEPLKLQEPRAVPEGGFTTPDELDQSMEETLAQRLLALRQNSTSSAESESTDPRPSVQTNSMLFAHSDVSDDILEELFSEDDEDAPSLEEEPSNQGGGVHPLPVEHLDRTMGKGEVVGDDRCEDNGHLDDSGIQNGEESSSSDEAAPTKDIQDDDLEGTTSGGKNEERATSEGDRMREIRDEIRTDIAQALEDGERLFKELEGRTIDKPEDVEESISDAVVIATDDSINDRDGESANITRTNSDAADKQHSDSDNAKDNHLNGLAVSGTDERTKNNLSDEKSESVRDDSEQTGQEEEEAPSDVNDSANGDVASNRELAEGDSSVGEREGEREKEKAKEEEEGEERIAEMRAQALSRHLKCITKDVLMFTERLQSLLVAVYEQLNSTAAKEQCISIIEAFVFKDIWQPILMLYRRFNYKKEECAAIAMTKYQHAMPQHIGVGEKFCLLREGAVIQDGSQASSSDYPYRAAVEELCKLQGYTCPLQKIECIVRVSRIVIECVGDYYESQGISRQSLETTVGCDDLLPILSYVIMRSSLPQIVSECSAMEEFIHEGYLFGEEGYCLTTCQTALSYVLKLGSTEELSKS